MLRRFINFATATIFGVALSSVTHSQPNTWEINAIYSTAGGSIQFIMLDSFYGIGSGLPRQALVASDGVTEHSFTFAHDVPDHYGPIGEGAFIEPAQAINNAFASYLFMPAGINAVTEYYNAGEDDYFLTAYSHEIKLLDAGFRPDWQRTGNSFPAWTSPFSAGNDPPPDLTPGCRLNLGGYGGADSHFYSISATECAAVTAQHPRGGVYESVAAFFGTLPDSETGTCPADQTPLYRLWNSRGSSHRYTTETLVRDEMRARGYVSEGYGPDSVAMCIGGNQ